MPAASLVTERGVGLCLPWPWCHVWGQRLQGGSLQEGRWVLVILEETPPTKTAWSGQVTPGEGTVVASQPAASLPQEP